MPFGLSAALRGGLVLSAALVSLTLFVIAYLWWAGAGVGLTLFAVLVAGIVALAWLYGTRKPLRFSTAPLFLGIVAWAAVCISGVMAAQNVVMIAVGVDVAAVVDRTWTTTSKPRGVVSHHCTVRRADGSPIPGEFTCVGQDPGDSIPVVIDPAGRFGPVVGPKSELSARRETLVMAVAGLVFLITIVIGSPTKRARSAGDPPTAEGFICPGCETAATPGGGGTPSR